MAAPNTALNTVHDYITDARVVLQDTVAPYRYDDSSLITAMNLALLETSRVRPDLFAFAYCDVVPQFDTSKVDATKVRLDQKFRLGVLYMLCAHALTRDQEDIQDERASQFTSVFDSIMLGLRKPGITAKGQ